MWSSRQADKRRTSHKREGLGPERYPRLWKGLDNGGFMLIGGLELEDDASGAKLSLYIRPETGPQ